MKALEVLHDAEEPKPVVAVVGGAVAGSEAARACAEHGAIPVVFEQGLRPYGKIEDGLPRWHVKLREKEYRKIDENLSRDDVIFVPGTEIGRDLSWSDLYEGLGFSAVLLANGAWRDRGLPVEGADAYVGRGLVYQNDFVYWFNHYDDENYEGPVYDVPDGTIVIGGGLASIDVVKIINLEIYSRALRDRGIEVDIVEMEVKGIPRTLEALGIAAEDLGVQGCTLYYRRTKEDMPLASAENPTPAQLQKLRAARAKIMDRVMRKYMVHFEPLCLPIGTIVEEGTLVGLRFQKTEIVDGRVKPLPGTEFMVRSPMVISSIGSIPRPIEGIPTRGELYHFEDWESGRLHELPGVFGLGNVLTGKGNIRDSRLNAIEIVEKVVAAYLGVADDPEDAPTSDTTDRVKEVARGVAHGPPMTVEAMKKLAERIEQRHAALGYRDYASWIAAHG